MSRSRVTIRDVAARAGVSHQTVSRVINKSDHVTESTRNRVHTAITELGYHPNAIARYMARGRTYTLACISPNLTDFTFASIIEAAETTARQRGYFLITASAPNEETFQFLVTQLLTSRRAEGLLVINPYIDGRYLSLPSDLAVVFLGARSRSRDFDSVSLDEKNAGYLATLHLLELGHRRIAHITGPLREDCAQDRLKGYQDALIQSDVQVLPELCFEGDWSATSGYRAVQLWLERQYRFSAIFAQNDRMAMGAIRSLADHGIRVPEEVSVVGFDDIPLASYFSPPLTTMHQDFSSFGVEAANLLIRRLEESQSEALHQQLTAKLVVRSSTAPLNTMKGGEEYSKNCSV